MTSVGTRVFAMLGCVLSAWLVACRARAPVPAIGTPGAAPIPAGARQLLDADDTRPIGTPHPIQLIRAAASGRWVVACQARVDTDGSGTVEVTRGADSVEGDALVPYLFRGGGDGLAIDELLSVSRDERWLVVLRGGQIVLIDDAQGTERVVERAARPGNHEAHRAVAFDADSRHLVYLSATGSVVIRDLAQQHEREISTGQERVVRIVPEPAGRWVRLLLDRGGPDLSLDFEGPPPRRSIGPGPLCGDLTVRTWMFGLRSTTWWLDTDTGQHHLDPDVLGRIDDVAIAKRPDRSIHMGSTEVVPSSCDGDVVAVSLRPLRLLVTCAANAAEEPLELFGPGFHVPLGGLRLRRGSESVVLVETPFVCPVVHACFALSDGAAVPLPDAARATAGVKILAGGYAAWSVVDSATGAIQRLLGATGNLGVRTGALASIDRTIVDVSHGRVLGDVPRTPLAVDLRGRALVPTGGGTRTSARGPLRWVVPRPQPPELAARDTLSSRVITGVAVGPSRAPLAGVTVTVSERPSSYFLNGRPRPATPPWMHPEEIGGVPGPGARSSQYALDDRTDAAGGFAWQPRAPGPYAVMLVASDGRVGAADDVHPGDAAREVILHRPGAIEIVCKGFAASDVTDGVKLIAGARSVVASCGETVSGLPPGAYLALARLDEFHHATAAVTVTSDRTSTARLVPPAMGTIRGTVVEYPGSRPIVGAWCDARVVVGEHEVTQDPETRSGLAGQMVIQISQGQLHVWCRYEGTFASGMTSVELGASADVTVRMVRYRPDAVNVGVDLEVEPGGARIRRVKNRAAHAGLRPGDLVESVDDVSLAGLSAPAMAALAFEFRPEASIRWSVLRDGQRRTVVAPPW